jgi:hypothetical protein
MVAAYNRSLSGRFSQSLPFARFARLIQKAVSVLASPNTKGSLPVVRGTIFFANFNCMTVIPSRGSNG